MGGACSTYGREEIVYGILVGKPEEKRPLGRPRHRWEDNIKMDLQEVGLMSKGVISPKMLMKYSVVLLVWSACARSTWGRGGILTEENTFNPLNAELNPIWPLLALFGARHILHISR